MLAKKYGVDLIMNAVDPLYNQQIFDAAFNVGAHYMDMAMTLSTPHPTEPYTKPGVKLGDYQFERAKAWKKKGLLAVVGLGVEPGMADVFARYAQDHLFDEIDEIGIRDGANLEVDGYEFAPSFSIWTTIEECLNPPVIWEKDRGWFTTAPFSEPEVFDFPEGIGKVEVVNVEHEEVLLVPRWVKARRVTFKYGLGDQVHRVLKTLHMLGLDSKEKIDVKGVQVAPRDVVAAAFLIRPISATRCTARRAPAPGSRGERADAARGLPVSGGRQRPMHETLGLPGRRRPDRVQPCDRMGPDRTRAMEGRRGFRARGVSTPCRSWKKWPSTNFRTECGKLKRCRPLDRRVAGTRTRPSSRTDDGRRRFTPGRYARVVELGFQFPLV